MTKDKKKMSRNPKVAIVILTWNKRKYVLELLTALKTINYDNYEIIVVDNASTDGTSRRIKENFPQVELVQNTENLGGTGGFNTGLSHVLKKGIYDYTWLLDNDALVEEDTLINLVKAMDEDKSIGIAGSRIIDPNIKDITVEAGAYFRSDTIGVKPLFRNLRNLNIENNIKEVDYVAICSALIRMSALEKVGLMDERYFIFWDDMDWGLQFKNKGYKVVSVLNSVVYHTAFTEKRGGALIDHYYGNRNPLLTYSKHFSLWKRFVIFHRYLRQKCTVMMLSVMSGKGASIKMPCVGIYDFITGHWGKKTVKTSPKETNIEPKEIVKPVDPKFPDRVENILLFNDGSKDDIYNVYNAIVKIYPNANYTLLISDDRVDFFDKGFQNIIKIDTQKSYSLIYLSKIFFTILRTNYDIALNIAHVSAFSYAVKRAYAFNHHAKKFEETNHNLKNMWKLILSTIFGEVAGILLLPIIYVSSLKYKNH